MLYQVLIDIIVPILLCASIGYFWHYKDWSFDRVFINRMVMKVGTPALVFNVLINVQLKYQAILEIAFASLLTLVGFLVLGFIGLRLFRLPYRAYLPSVVCGNVGNMGLPLCLFAFGETGLALAIVVFTFNVFVIFMLGTQIVSGKFLPGRLFSEPVFHAIFLALLVLWLDFPVPGWVKNTTTLLGDLCIPLMLIMLGYSIRSLHIQSLQSAIKLSILRLGGGFLIAWVVAEALDMQGIVRSVLLIQSSMPVAVYMYLFASIHNQSPVEVAGGVVLSTLLSLIMLPFLLMYVI